MNFDQWHYLPSKVERAFVCGPINEDEMASLVKNKALSKSDLVKHPFHTNDKWMFASQVTALVGHFREIAN